MEFIYFRNGRFMVRLIILILFNNNFIIIANNDVIIDVLSINF